MTATIVGIIFIALATSPGPDQAHGDDARPSAAAANRTRESASASGLRSPSDAAAELPGQLGRSGHPPPHRIRRGVLIGAASGLALGLALAAAKHGCDEMLCVTPFVYPLAGVAVGGGIGLVVVLATESGGPIAPGRPPAAHHVLRAGLRLRLRRKAAVRVPARCADAGRPVSAAEERSR